MGKDRARVWSGQTFDQQSRVGSGQRFAGLDRVQEKLHVDHSGYDRNADVSKLHVL